MKPKAVIDKQEVSAAKSVSGGGAIKSVSGGGAVKSVSGGGAVKLGDLIWVNIPSSSWWPAQVVDAHTVSDALKPSHRSVGEVLVRLYGSYKYLYVDPMKSRSDLRRELNETKSTHRRLFLETLEMDRPNSSSSSKRKRSTSDVQVQATAPKKPNQNVLGENSTTQTINGSSSKVNRSPSAKNGDLSKKLKPNATTPISSGRRVKVMQSLGLAAPSGSPFRNGRVHPIGD